MMPGMTSHSRVLINILFILSLVVAAFLLYWMAAVLLLTAIGPSKSPFFNVSLAGWFGMAVSVVWVAVQHFRHKNIQSPLRFLVISLCVYMLGFWGQIALRG